MSVEKSCRLLEWDSCFFGRRIARLEGGDPRLMRAAIPWCLGHGVDCLYFLADVGDQTAIDEAARLGFQMVDLRVTFVRTLTGHDGSTECPQDVRPVRPEDVPALRTIARVSHWDSRFFADRHFCPEDGANLFDTWITKSCAGYADCVLTVDAGGGPAGYISCHLRGEAAGDIGLVAVADSQRGRGLGGQLVAAAVDWFAAKGVRQVRVVTQGRNAAAQRLYQRAGFVTESIGLWYHRWFSGAGRAAARMAA